MGLSRSIVESDHNGIPIRSPVDSPALKLSVTGNLGTVQADQTRPRTTANRERSVPLRASCAGIRRVQVGAALGGASTAQNAPPGAGSCSCVASTSSLYVRSSAAHQQSKALERGRQHGPGDAQQRRGRGAPLRDWVPAPDGCLHVCFLRQTQPLGQRASASFARPEASRGHRIGTLARRASLLQASEPALCLTPPTHAIHARAASTTQTRPIPLAQPAGAVSNAPLEA